MAPLPWFTADDVVRLLPMAHAVDVLESALAGGLDPAADPARSVLPVAGGQVLLMPSESAAHVGVKLVTYAPANSGRGLPRIQGVYVLLDAATLAPVALLDGSALTSLRTPAMSAVAVRHLARPSATRLVVFGSGPQAEGHVEAVRSVRALDDVAVVGRDAARAAALAIRVGGRPGSALDVADADIVVCATSAREPLFDGDLVQPGAVVVAVGSHQPDARELDSVLVRRAHVVVEDRATALREAGDVVLAGLAADDLTTLAEVVTGRVTLAPDRPMVWKSVGMAWQDLVTAAAVVERVYPAAATEP